MKEVKIIRLKNNDDIICLCETKEGYIDVEHPYLIKIEIEVKKSTQILVLKHWLPINLVEENKACLFLENVMLTLSPKIDIEEYYLNMLLIKEDSLSKDDIKVLLENIDAKVNNKIH